MPDRPLQHLSALESTVYGRPVTIISEIVIRLLIFDDHLRRVAEAARPSLAGEAASGRGVDRRHRLATIDTLQEKYPLAGIVAEGLAPYATLSASQDQALLRAVYRGVPVVKTARGNANGLVRVSPDNLFIEGNNLTATKARLR